MVEARVCASCPEAFHDQVTAICRSNGIQKAFGKTGDMLDSLKGHDWVAKWEAKVVMATVTKAQTLGSAQARIICIAGGRHCDLEMAQQPKLVRAIKQEMQDPSFRVRVDWLEFSQFLDEYGDPATSSTEAVSQTTQAQLCKYYASSSGCKNGDSCKFVHASSAASSAVPDQGKGVKAKGKGKGYAKEMKVVGEGKQAEAEHKTTAVPKANVKTTTDFTCDMCHKAFKSSAALEQHQEDAGHTPMWTCGECGREFGTERAWQQHQQATGHLDPTCPVCQKPFSSAQLLSQHLTDSKKCSNARNAHEVRVKVNSMCQGTAQAVRCETCGRAFPNESARRQHWDSKPECGMLGSCLEVSLCSICNQVFDTWGLLQAHVCDSGHGDHKKLVQSDCLLRLRIQANIQKLKRGPGSSKVLHARKGVTWPEVIRMALASRDRLVQIIGKGIGNVDALLSLQDLEKECGQSLFPEDILSELQELVEETRFFFYLWALWCRDRGALGSEGPPVAKGLTRPCDCGAGARESDLLSGGCHACACGQLRRPLRSVYISKLSEEQNQLLAQLHMDFLCALVEVGFQFPDSSPFLTVSIFPRGPWLLVDRVPKAGVLRSLDDAAMDMSSGPYFGDTRGWAKTEPVSSDAQVQAHPTKTWDFAQLCTLTVAQIKEILKAAGADMADEEAKIRAIGICDKEGLASYVEARLREPMVQHADTASQQFHHYYCDLCGRRFAAKGPHWKGAWRIKSNVTLEDHKEKVHKRILQLSERAEAHLPAFLVAMSNR